MTMMSNAGYRPVSDGELFVSDADCDERFVQLVRRDDPNGVPKPDVTTMPGERTCAACETANLADGRFCSQFAAPFAEQGPAHAPAPATEKRRVLRTPMRTHRDRRGESLARGRAAQSRIGAASSSRRRWSAGAPAPPGPRVRAGQPGGTRSPHSRCPTACLASRGASRRRAGRHALPQRRRPPDYAPTVGREVL
jgi:hypothetical protein